MTLTEVEETQKRGAVFVIFFDGGGNNTEVVMRGSSILGSLSVRNDGNHICLNGDDPRIKNLESTLKYVSGKFSRARIRSHYGKFWFFGLEARKATVKFPTRYELYELFWFAFLSF